MVGFIISPSVIDMPLAMAAADPNASESLEAIWNLHYRRSHPLRPRPGLIFGASTGFPCGHLIVGTERRNARSHADFLEVSLRESLNGPSDGAVAFQQKQGRNRCDPVSVARGIIFARQIQQRRERDAE